MTIANDALLALDRQRVWHPYSAMPGTDNPLLVNGAAGACLQLADGRELVDGMSSWWAAIHGYRHPALDRALADQAGRMSHVMFGGLTHEPAITLADTLAAITPPGLEHVFLCDSGSVSVEVALKMALQYWRSRGRPEKRRLLTWRGGYHGDTFHAMSVCDPDGGMHALWQGSLPGQCFVRPPPGDFHGQPDPAYLNELERAVKTHAHELAGVIVEPVVQGAGGMRFHHPAYLQQLQELCQTHDVLLIFDEIATGFGRTGRFFAAEHAGISPDIICLGKALTGGYLTLAATLCTTEVARGISDGDVPLLAHGPTFMGNPLACAVAIASIRLLQEQDTQTRVGHIENRLRQQLDAAYETPGVADVRVLGAIGVIELDHDVDMSTARQASLEYGVWLRPFRSLIYTMPPYICSDEQLDRITTAMCAAARRG